MVFKKNKRKLVTDTSAVVTEIQVEALRTLELHMLVAMPTLGATMKTYATNNLNDEDPHFLYEVEFYWKKCGIKSKTPVRYSCLTKKDSFSPDKRWLSGFFTQDGEEHELFKHTVTTSGWKMVLQCGSYETPPDSKSKDVLLPFMHRIGFGIGDVKGFLPEDRDKVLVASYKGPPAFMCDLSPK